MTINKSLQTNKQVVLLLFGLFVSYSMVFSQNPRNILTIGDSNGAFDYGWVNQLQKMLPNDKIFNVSISGNTIGFDNLDRVELNTLRNLDNYLHQAEENLGGINYILIMLGTNDAKYIFKNRQDEVASNMETLIHRIKYYNFKNGEQPKIVVMSPPPCGSNKILEKKYRGIGKRVNQISRKYETLANLYNCSFVDINKGLHTIFYQHSQDGIHLDKVGQKAIASILVNQLFNESFKNSDSDSNSMEIYLLIGQSNMAGRAKIRSEDKDTICNVYLFTGNEEKPWEKAANPLNKYSTVRKEIAMQKLGPGYGFARALSNKYPDKKIGLVVNARGGTSIEEWKPGSKLYYEAVSQTKKALKFGALKGVIWHQGESDVSNYKSYLPKIRNLIESFRNDFNKPKLPFLIGELSEDNPERVHFNKVISKLPSKLKNTVVISSDGTTTIDSTHFDSASQNLIGKRYAEEIIIRLEKELEDERLRNLLLNTMIDVSDKQLGKAVRKKLLSQKSKSSNKIKR